MVPTSVLEGAGSVPGGGARRRDESLVSAAAPGPGLRDSAGARGVPARPGGFDAEFGSWGQIMNTCIIQLINQ